MKDHETVRIPIKEADIDKGIVPFVNWLNKHEHVYTLYCCEGDNNPDTYSTYVCFLCFSTITLSKILDVIEKVLGCPWETGPWFMHVDHNLPEYPVRYCVRFKTKSKLEKLQEALGKQRKTP